MKSKENRKTHKHTVVKQTDRHTLKLCTIIWQVQCSLCSAVTRTLLHEDHLLLNTWLALLIIVLKLGSAAPLLFLYTLGSKDPEG